MPMWAPAARTPRRIVPASSVTSLPEITAVSTLQLRSEIRFPERLSHKMNNVALRLHATRHAKERCGLGQDREGVEDIFPQDDVDKAGFILERHERDTRCRGRRLPANDQPRITYPASMWQPGNGPRLGKSLFPQRFPDSLERVAARAMVRGAVVPGNFFSPREVKKRGHRFVFPEGQAVALPYAADRP